MKKWAYGHAHTIHAKRRAMERYGLDLNKKMREDIKKLIKTGSAKKIEQQSNSRVLYEVEVDDAIIRLIYSRTTHKIVTLLPL